jgi:hypothetical protein
VGAVVPFAAALVLNFHPWLAFSGYSATELAKFGPLRYAVVPSMFLIAMVAVAADRLARRPALWGSVAAALLLLGLGALVLVHAGPGPTGRSGGPRWSTEVDGAEQQCAAGATTVTIPISPQGWQVAVACQTLDP